MMLNIIIIIVIFASIISAVVYMSSSSLRQAISSNQSANAWNLAEAGYRFLSTNYVLTDDSNGNGTADDEKAAFLGNVNGRTYIIPNVGSFTLTVRPYWFYNATGATGTITNVTVKLPGTTPANFTMPATGNIQIGDDTTGVGIRNYTGGSFNSGTGIFTCTLTSAVVLNQGGSVYLVLNPNATQNNLTPGSTLTLNIANYPLGAFPRRDGLIQIGSEIRNYRYSNATRIGNVLTLTNLQHSDKSAFTTSVTAATNVTFKKYLTIQSRGQVGTEQRTLSFNQALFDSFAVERREIKLDKPTDLSDNFSLSSSVTSSAVQTLLTSGGGSAVFAIINSLSTTGSGAGAYNCGAFWFSHTDFINELWAYPPAGIGKYLLDYDVQVKTGTGNNLQAGTVGLAIRAKNIGTPSETYLGLTFMKYNLANLYFTAGGPTAINPGDTVVGASSGATGIVQGTPEITSGSWATGNAAGKIRFASVTGTFSANEYLKVGGVNRAQVNGSNYFPATTDYIPDAIKPKPTDFSPARYNIGPLLLVLWERQSTGTFRWLAFKDISYDDYAKGLQDFAEPAGSCTGSCPGYDGQIIDDNASIYIRIQERKLDLGSGSPVKVNDINVFYGDASSRYTTRINNGMGNDIPYDINYLRRIYAIAVPPQVFSGGTAIWLPPSISSWNQSYDFFSHIESGTPSGSQPQFQWDAVNPNVTDISVLKICYDGSAACKSAPNGTLRLTELVTPDSGEYKQPEIGLFACGKLRPTSGDYATAAFAEFGLQTAESPTTGGFTDTSLSW
jgi:hypothetical protein